MRQFKIKSGNETVKAARYDGRGVPLVYLQIAEVDRGFYPAVFASALISPAQARRLAAALVKFANVKKVKR